jgi:steroid delta-isomerase-like uncharacterized protein
MSTEQNKKVIEQLFLQCINDRKFSLVNQLLHPEFKHHGFGGNGPEGFKQVINSFTDAFPDMQIQLLDIIAEGDKVVTRGSWKGTHMGTFMGLPGTSKKVETEYIDVWKLRDGKCIENWVQMDIAGLMQQLGMVPSNEPESSEVL